MLTELQLPYNRTTKSPFRPTAMAASSRKSRSWTPSAFPRHHHKVPEKISHNPMFRQPYNVIRGIRFTHENKGPLLIRTSINQVSRCLVPIVHEIGNARWKSGSGECFYIKKILTKLNCIYNKLYYKINVQKFQMTIIKKYSCFYYIHDTGNFTQQAH